MQKKIIFSKIYFIKNTSKINIKLRLQEKISFMDA